MILTINCASSANEMKKVFLLNIGAKHAWKQFPILKNHKIDNMVDFKIRENEVETDKFCPEHEGKLIDAFCHQHRKLCCCICLAKHHRSCQLIEVIADMTMEKERNDIQGIVSTFSDLENVLKICS